MKKLLDLLFEKDPAQNSRLTVPNIVRGAVALPTFGFIFCILLSYIKDFKDSTRTHCNVFNLTPSISAAIGSFIPQKYVWQACIALHSAPRFLFAHLYRLVKSITMKNLTAV